MCNFYGIESDEVPGYLVARGRVTRWDLLPVATQTDIIKAIAGLRALHARLDPVAFEGAVGFVNVAIEETHSQAYEAS